MSLSKSDFVMAISLRAEIDQALARDVLNILLETVTQSLVRGEAVTLTGFGRFDVREQAARTGRNPQTGEALQIPARRIPKFVPGSKLKEAVR